MQETEVVVNCGLIDLLSSKEGERKEEEEAIFLIRILRNARSISFSNLYVSFMIDLRIS